MVMIDFGDASITNGLETITISSVDVSNDGDGSDPREGKDSHVFKLGL